MTSKFNKNARKECLCWICCLIDVDTPAIIIQKEKKSMLESFPQGCQQLVGVYSQVMAPCLAAESPNGLVAREAHCSSARGSEAGAEGPRAGTGWGWSWWWAQGGCAGLLELCNAHLHPSLPEADSAPLNGKGTMWWEIGKCHCSGIKGDITSGPAEDTIPFGHQKYLPFL